MAIICKCINTYTRGKSVWYNIRTSGRVSIESEAGVAARASARKRNFQSMHSLRTRVIGTYEPLSPSPPLQPPSRAPEDLPPSSRLIPEKKVVNRWGKQVGDPLTRLPVQCRLVTAAADRTGSTACWTCFFIVVVVVFVVIFHHYHRLVTLSSGRVHNTSNVVYARFVMDHRRSTTTWWCALAVMACTVAACTGANIPPSSTVTGERSRDKNKKSRLLDFLQRKQKKQIF